MLNTSLQNKQAENLRTLFANSTLTIYSGTPPTDANTALSGNTALAAHTVPSFGAPVAGVITAAAIANDTVDATGTATFARLVSNDTNDVLQLTVGTSGAHVIMSNTSLQASGTSIVNSLTLGQPAN